MYAKNFSVCKMQLMVLKLINQQQNLDISLPCGETVLFCFSRMGLLCYIQVFSGSAHWTYPQPTLDASDTLNQFCHTRIQNSRIIAEIKIVLCLALPRCKCKCKINIYSAIKSEDSEALNTQQFGDKLGLMFERKTTEIIGPC